MKGLTGGLMPFWDGLVRDAREDPRGQVEDWGVDYSEAPRDEGIAIGLIKRGGPGTPVLGLGRGLQAVAEDAWAAAHACDRLVAEERRARICAAVVELGTPRP